MKKILLLILCITATQNISSGDDKTEPETISKIASLVTNFGSVLANPNNKSNVIMSICGMIASILGLAADTRQTTNLEIQKEVTNILISGKKAEIVELQNALKKLCAMQVECLDNFIKE
jgi:hypothetical protein